MTIEAMRDLPPAFIPKIGKVPQQMLPYQMTAPAPWLLCPQKKPKNWV